MLFTSYMFSYCFVCSFTYFFLCFFFFFFKQKTAYEFRIIDWSSDVCSSDLGCVDYARSRRGVPRCSAPRSKKRSQPPPAKDSDGTEAGQHTAPASFSALPLQWSASSTAPSAPEPGPPCPPYSAISPPHESCNATPRILQPHPSDHPKPFDCLGKIGRAHV